MFHLVMIACMLYKPFLSDSKLRRMTHSYEGWIAIPHCHPHNLKLSRVYVSVSVRSRGVIGGAIGEQTRQLIRSAPSPVFCDASKDLARWFH